ncbi:MAG: alpha/beta fold hydrolase [Pseudooceanicola atlanticus]
MSEPLVLIPGMMCDHQVFDALISAFGPDRSITFALPTRGERMEEIASELLSELPPKFALLGHDFGGCIAMELFRRAPERVQRIALVSTSPLADTPQQSAAREDLLVKCRAGQLEAALREVMKPDYLAPGPQRFEILNRYMHTAMALGPEIFRRQTRALQRRRDQQGTLRKVKVPALVIGGAQDGLVPPKRMEFMSELIPNAQLELIEDAGHFPMLEQPEAFCRVIFDWLAMPAVKPAVGAR